MTKQDDDPGHHPYEGSSPSTDPSAPYDHSRGLTREIQAQSRLFARADDSWAPRSLADHISTGAWSAAFATYAAAQTYANIDLHIVSSTILAYLGR